MLVRGALAGLHATSIGPNRKPQLRLSGSGVSSAAGMQAWQRWMGCSSGCCTACRCLEPGPCSMPTLLQKALR